MPSNLEFVDLGGAEFKGSSGLLLIKLAQPIGFELVVCAFSGCICVEDEDCRLFNIKNHSVEESMPMDGVVYLYPNICGEMVLANINILTPVSGSILYKSAVNGLNLY